MQFSQLALMYLLMGLGVMIGQARLGSNRNWSTLLGACVFWPLFVPFLMGTSQPAADSRVSDEAAEVDEVLDRMLKTTPPESVLSQKVLELRDTYHSQLNWLVETTQLLEKQVTTRAHEAAASPASVELRAQLEATTAELRELFSGIRELGVEVQLWKRSEGSSERIAALITQRLDQLRSCVQDVR